jgi:hypothetical protein
LLSNPSRPAVVELGVHVQGRRIQDIETECGETTRLPPATVILSAYLRDRDTCLNPVPACCDVPQYLNRPRFSLPTRLSRTSCICTFECACSQQTLHPCVATSAGRVTVTKQGVHHAPCNPRRRTLCSLVVLLSLHASSRSHPVVVVTSLISTNSNSPCQPR